MDCLPRLPFPEQRVVLAQVLGVSTVFVTTVSLLHSPFLELGWIPISLHSLPTLSKLSCPFFCGCQHRLTKQEGRVQP